MTIERQTYNLYGAPPPPPVELAPGVEMRIRGQRTIKVLDDQKVSSTSIVDGKHVTVELVGEGINEANLFYGHPITVNIFGRITFRQTDSDST